MIKAKNNGNSARNGIPPPVSFSTGTKPVHHSDWSKMSEADHFVQFYESDDFLLDSLAGFIGTGLQSGDGCIVVATKAHRDALERRLRESGCNPEKAMKAGRYISLDAAETLSKFMVDGSPEPKRFAEVIGNIIKLVQASGRQVRIFGEMVALLFEEEKGAAIELEELWNKLAETYPFTLFCAYPLDHFKGDSYTEPFKHVCNGHSRVLPAESYAFLTETDDQLRTITLLQQRARSLESEILERKRAENELLAVKSELEVQLAEREQLLSREQSARTEAEQANRMKDEFLATISHELRTPLNAILGWSRMLLSDRLDEVTKTQAVATINRNASSQMQLIEDILDVSRIITGNLRLNIGSVDLASVINAAIDSVRLAADSKDILLEIILDPSIRHISGDPSRLQQVIWNLLSNAIKFTPSGGHVGIRLKRARGEEDSGVEIEVSDTGQGIDTGFLPFIFDRFRQADGSRTRRHGGLGLGLAIVRHLVELHGGTISADSDGEGHGSTFTIRLPLISPGNFKSLRKDPETIKARKRVGKDTTQIPLLTGIKILVVDDNLDNLEMLALILTSSEAIVQTAASVSEALEMFESVSPDVLVSDLAMPDEDGYSLIAKIRTIEQKDGKTIPAVALTAHVSTADRVRALSAGFNMFVPKPFEIDELLLAIDNLIRTGTR